MQKKGRTKYSFCDGDALLVPNLSVGIKNPSFFIFHSRSK